MDIVSSVSFLAEAQKNVKHKSLKEEQVAGIRNLFSGRCTSCSSYGFVK